MNSTDKRKRPTQYNNNRQKRERNKKEATSPTETEKLRDIKLKFSPKGTLRLKFLQERGMSSGRIGIKNYDVIIFKYRLFRCETHGLKKHRYKIYLSSTAQFSLNSALCSDIFLSQNYLFRYIANPSRF